MSSAIPLCVDLDGTLLRTDTLAETMVAILANAKLVRKLPYALAPNRALLKQRLTSLALISPEFLPVNTELMDLLRRQKEAGRTIILVTAADESIAKKIASHVGLFDQVIASDGKRNLKGDKKAKELIARFGRGGFSYAGDSIADLAVWREASDIILVNTYPSVARRARELGKPVIELDRRKSSLREAIRAMRPHQWVKNLLVFIPFMASREFSDFSGLLNSVIMFAAFCATASGIYLINDIMDVEADRQHPRKRSRPLASGSLSIWSGAGVAAWLLLVGSVLGAYVSAAAPLTLYAVVSITYSLGLKRFPLVDVFVLAALYTARVLAGGIASGHPTSLWLLAFSGFVFLSLAFVKRTAEIVSSKDRIGDNQTISGRGYFIADLPALQMFGIASTFASSVVLALFVSTTAASVQHYASPDMLWGVVPIVLFWQLRLWLSTQRGHMHDDPIVYASRDWVSWVAAASAIVLAMMASVGISPW